MSTDTPPNPQPAPPLAEGARPIHPPKSPQAAPSAKGSAKASAEAGAAPARDLPQCRIEGAVAHLRLVRPARRNALRPADLQALIEHLNRLDADPAIRVIVLSADLATGRRPVFCAGYDLDGFDAAQHDPRLFERTVDLLEAVRPVTVCALGGSVHGGATDLVLACDLRVAVQGSAFHMPAAGLGLHYYPSGLRRYVHRLGLDLAKRAFFAGRPLAVEELQAAGLFDAVVAPEDFEAAVATLVGRVAGLAPLAAQATKQSLQELARGEADLWRLREREALTLDSLDFLEGRAALAQGRPPAFQGR